MQNAEMWAIFHCVLCLSQKGMVISLNDKSFKPVFDPFRHIRPPESCEAGPDQIPEGKVIIYIWPNGPYRRCR